MKVAPEVCIDNHTQWRLKCEYNRTFWNLQTQERERIVENIVSLFPSRQRNPDSFRIMSRIGEEVVFPFLEPTQPLKLYLEKI